MFAARLASSARTIAAPSVGAVRRFAAKDVRQGTEVRALMLEGVEKLADAVQTTLGPKGRNAIIEQSFGAPKITKDGVTVAKSIEFKDPFHNMGAQLVRQVASKTNDIAGDGTTTATVLSRAIFREGCKAVAAGMNPMDLKRGMDRAVEVVEGILRDMSVTVTTPELITQVATISANSDTEVGGLIGKAMERVGKEGVITVQDGRKMADELEVVEGMKFDRGYISPYFVNDAKTQRVDMENPYILLVEKKVSTIASIVPILEAAAREKKPLIIIAEDVESEALATLVVNKLRSGLSVCAVKAPGFGDNRKANLQDLAEMTGGTVISEDVGLKLENATLSQLGRARKVTVSKDDTLILDGAGEKEAIDARCELIRQMMEETKSEYEREKLQERLAKLSGGVAVLKVGGSSEVEVNEKKDRVTDALNATRAAVEEGIVPGGGVALLVASKSLDAVAAETTNDDQRVGVEIIRSALREPMRAIANNAGVSGDVVVGKVLEFSDTAMGYDAQNDVYVDMVKAGIIDPTLVVRTALLDAKSVAALLTTSETAIVDLPEEGGGAGAMGGAGMGGMGGMGGGMPGMF